MSVKFVDRVSLYPNRYKATREDGAIEYLTLERADNPTVVGTPLNAATFNAMMENLDQDIAAVLYDRVQVLTDEQKAQALENIGALSMELLWENADPTSEFNAKFIQIDLNAYDYVAIDFYVSLDTPYYTALQIHKKQSVGSRASYTEGSKIVSRSINAITDDGIDFQKGLVYNEYGKSASSTGRTMIPVRIYGIKGVV